MPSRITIPKYAKAEAKEGLRLRKQLKAGLTKEEANLLGINSGVERAKQLIRNKYLSEEDAKSVARFYLRFRNKKSPKSKIALKLWGGNFGKFLTKVYYNKTYKRLFKK